MRKCVSVKKKSSEPAGGIYEVAASVYGGELRASERYGCASGVQLPFLNIISHKEGISQRELAECLHVKPPTVAVTVKRLEKADVIYRRPDPNDMRISRIYLTEKGIRISAQIEVVIQENEKVLTAGFSEEELELARHFFTRMIQNLNVLSGGKEGLPLEGVRSPEKDKEAWSCETRKGGRA